MLQICARLGLSSEETARLGALWGKSAEKGGGTMSLLLCHMLDTASVAECMFDHYLAPATRAVLDRVSGGRGRRFFAWICGIHDCGKATPAFQRKSSTEAVALAGVGLGWRAGMVTAETSRQWSHDKAGAFLLRHALRTAGRWERRHVDWVCPMVSGHHGTLRGATAKDITHARGDAHGKTPEWKRTQDLVVEAFTSALGFESLSDAQPVAVPARAEQLGLLGLVVMADWIASDSTRFPGIPDLAQITLEGARRRAEAAWDEGHLGGGLRRLRPTGDADVVELRFGHRARASQALALDVVRAMEAPGLVFLEAPMGEGKTKTALAAAEVLAERFGLSGVFVGMPTQATADPMFTQVRAWAADAEPGAEDAAVLLHGKRAFNTEWKAIRNGDWTTADARFRSVQEDAADSCCANRQGPADWFLGPRRGLLAHLTVGTVDQLLYAATRTRHVMLRTAGLAGKVVILDEIHACDVYMSQFLKEALHWLGQARVPVLLLSATLPPAQRAELADAYMSGTTDAVGGLELPAPEGYPNVTAVGPGMAAPVVVHAPTWRDDLPVRVRVLAEPPARRGGTREDPDQDGPVVDLLTRELAEGGVALVIRNTVRRAQRTYRGLAAAFPHERVILHGQLTTSARADRTEGLLDQLGPSGTPRPGRLILVATQVAEQSFDIDADLLVTDIAPIDLLLQRIGRVHRHTTTERPGHLHRPTVYVTALQPRSDAPPAIDRGAEFVYGRHLLLRTAAAVLEAGDSDGWAVPSQVPHLVSAVYSDADLVPDTWAATAERARGDWEAVQEDRRRSAVPFLLSRPGEHVLPHLDGLHHAATEAASEDHLAATVRDGDMSIEVVLVIRTSDGYRTLAGHRLGPGGAPQGDVLDSLAGDMMRLPQRLTSAALDHLVPLPGWAGHAWLRHTRALVLDTAHTARLGDHALAYDSETGLTYTRGT
ncbi:CRISPR-associated helicase Cas3' [Streptomyces sp. NBC_01754]|uniref:CRISPR-associated helicase Cas3' n=1 Tax=Streptomyces sp. NBC_01754 TaxID=2975930 RepID=UPI002DDBF586|nr:CRISPR-associated helicase Cas3' [Streptomyces sp. NBC_01754]WSC91234.1 CRISPR-associated helicase Cas3' [Streptomyces sp. NBC_01754]